MIPILDVVTATFLMTYQKVSRQFMLDDAIKRAALFDAVPRIHVQIYFRVLCNWQSEQMIVLQNYQRLNLVFILYNFRLKTLFIIKSSATT